LTNYSMQAYLLLHPDDSPLFGDGRAGLEFEVRPHESGSVLRQSATFEPLGLAGIVHWYGVWLLRQLVFSGMLRGIAHAAEKNVNIRRVR
jgi:hypothetical protein